MIGYFSILKANYLYNYFQCNPTYLTTVHQRHRQTDRQYDDGITAQYIELRSKNLSIFAKVIVAR